MNIGAMQNELITALEWYVDQGVTDVLLDEVIDRTLPVEVAPIIEMPRPSPKDGGSTTPVFLGKSDAYDEAVKLAKSATTLEELKNIIAEFDGIAIKKTASNIVFGDGNPNADIMLIGDAPFAEEDREGKPFVGAHGALLDKILSCIDLSRDCEDVARAVYVTNIINWRPPGNRSPAPAEIEVSLPFIERHIQLVAPKILIICGTLAAKSLLGRSESLSRLRKTWHDYTPITKGIALNDGNISAIVTYPPSSLISTPLQKKSVWADMLEIQTKLKA